MVTLRQLAHARALAASGSFRAAATELGLTQPALTRSIRALEKELGVRLFERRVGGARVEPTPFGEVLLPRAGEILDQAHDLEREIRLRRGLDLGLLRVAIGPHPANLHGPGVVAKLLAAHPHLRVQLLPTSWREAAAQVLAREVELAFAETSELADDERLEIEAVGSPRLYLYARRDHPLARRRRLDLGDLSAFPWVSTRIPPRAARFLTDLAQGRAGSLDPDLGDFVPAVEVDDVATARKIVLQSHVVGWGLLSQIAQELERESLVVLDFHAPYMRLAYGFIRLRRRTAAPATLAFGEATRRAESELRERERDLCARHGIAGET